MKRESLTWGALGAIVPALPVILRALAGQPLAAGTESYVFAIPVLLLTVASIIAMGASVLLAHRILRRFLGIWEMRTTLGLLVSAPAVLSSTMFPSHALFALMLTVSVYLWLRGSRSRILSVILFTALLVLVGLKVLMDGTRSPALALVEFGGLNAYGIFTLIAAIMGAFVLWQNKARNYFITLAIVILVGCSFFLPTLMLFGSLAVVTVAGIGLARLRKRRWTFPLVQTLTLLLFLCGILFTAVTLLAQLVHAPPNAGLASGFAELRFTLPPGTVLSHPSYGPWLTYWSGHPLAVIPDDDLQAIWSSRNLKETTVLLKHYDISSIVVTSEMKNGLVWSGDEDGLLFLLTRSTTFKSVENASTVEAWAFVPSP
jgi:hypothetical protein